MIDMLALLLPLSNELKLLDLLQLHLRSSVSILLESTQTKRSKDLPGARQLQIRRCAVIFAYSC